MSESEPNKPIQEGPFSVESVKKVGNCKLSKDEPTKMRCPVEMTFNNDRGLNSGSKQGSFKRFNSTFNFKEQIVSLKMYIWQENGNWVADDQLRSRIQADTLLSKAGVRVRYAEDVEPNISTHFDDGGPSESQIYNAIQDLYDKTESDGETEKEAFFLESVKKIGNCTPVATEPTKMNCPVDVTAGWQGGANSIPQKYTFNQYISIWQENGNWVADSRVKSRIQLVMLFSIRKG
ncbi:hypothetical protein [Xenorhabdus stockiae]|uniref:hypothetical protein n=1 Tax=Xenorhabdus stockiae TaxID=351614 RepID=UPI0014755787|nr:hypothetical protein [Xenorhabdus stockiae]